MPTQISLGSWKTWAIVLVVVFFVIWLVWGGDRNIEVVGLTPLAPPSVMTAGASVAPLRPLVVNIAPPQPLPVPSTVPSPVPQPPGGASGPSHNVDVQDDIPIREVAVVPSQQPARRFRSIGEQLSCECMEEILGRQVQVNIRPDILRNHATGHNLEFDLYDPVSQCAVEYDGRQHREFVAHFHRTQEDFANTQRLDRLKDRLAAENGIRLIRIADTVDTCEPDATKPSGFRHNSRIRPEERRRRIMAYLRAQMIAGADNPSLQE